MIYNKEVAFPHPVLMEGQGSYKNGEFLFEIEEVTQNTNEYIFKFSYEITSDFIIDCIKTKKANVIFVIQSKDNRFYTLENQTFIDGKSVGKIIIPKTRIALLKNKTKIQLFVNSALKFNFLLNEDLEDFYSEIKNEIEIEKNSALAISNEVIFDEESKSSPELFEKKTDGNLSSEFGIEIKSDVILLKFKKESYQFLTLNQSKKLNYLYLYMGLQKAITQFILDVNLNLEKEYEDPIYLDDFNLNNFDGLNYKLLYLMKNKGVERLDFYNIDEVIYLISDNMIDKFAIAINGIGEDGD